MEEKIEELLDLWEEGCDLGMDVRPEELSNDPAIIAQLVLEIERIKRMDWLERSFHESIWIRPATPRHKAGSILDRRFELVRVLGEGGFAAVWLARDTLIGKDVAIKIPHIHNDRLNSELLLREYHATNAHRHSHIVPTIAIGGYMWSFFIVSEYIGGETLADRIGRGAIEPTEAVRVVREIASALTFLHTRQLIHRDLKPANVLLDRAGRSYLTDFGIALRTAFGSAIVPPSMAGTLPYMAPEQFVPDSPIDSRCDIYALGLILYEMLTGRRPYADGEGSELGARLLAGSPPWPSSANPNVPRYLDWIVCGCLARDPDDRYYSANELIEKLDHPEWPWHKIRPSRGWDLPESYLFTDGQKSNASASGTAGVSPWVSNEVNPRVDARGSRSTGIRYQTVSSPYRGPPLIRLWQRFKCISSVIHPFASFQWIRSQPVGSAWGMVKTAFRFAFCIASAGRNRLPSQLGKHRMQSETCIIRVSRFRNSIGCIRFDERDCNFLADESIPRVVLSDIRVTYNRERILFGYSGDGYMWEEVEMPQA